MELVEKLYLFQCINLEVFDMNYYVLYRTETLEFLSYLAEDIVEIYPLLPGQSISTNFLNFDAIPYPNDVVIQNDGSVIKH